MRISHNMLLATLASVVLHTARTWGAPELVWEELTPLPVAAHGLFLGVQGNALIVSGGASTEPGRANDWRAECLDTVHVLPPNSETWREEGRLSRSRAYGATVSTSNGLWLIGGIDGTRTLDSVVRLDWKNDVLEIHDLPSAQARLPTPRAMHQAALLGDRIYVVGGAASASDALESQPVWTLNSADPGAAWEVHDAAPGPARLQPILVARDGALHLFGGTQVETTPNGAQRVRVLSDGYRFTTLKGWEPLPTMPRPLTGAAAVAFGQAHILVFADTTPEYPSEHLAYHTITNTWTSYGPRPEGRIASNAVLLNEGMVLPLSERLAENNIKVLSGAIRPYEGSFTGTDYAALGLYMALLTAIGFYFSKREKDTEAFFLGGRKIPWWAVGISILGTSTSAITYLAIPGIAYATNWAYILGNFSPLILAPIVIAFYLPRLRAANFVTPYEYLEKRFNLGVRIYGSIVFILFQLGRMAIVLYLPAIALSAATGIDIRLSILGMGLMSTLYTVLGGIEAVIWTDVIQSVILVFGAIMAFCLIVLRIDMDFDALLASANAADKFHIFDWSPDMTTATIWVVVIGYTFASTYPMTADQTVVQRYLATSTAKDAAKAIYTNALLGIPISLIFYGLGTALWAFFKQNPDLLNPSLKNDAVLPLFIAEQFPSGLRGIIIAGVFAAAMSSLDSSMNSLSAVLVNDYYRRFSKKMSERRALLVARILTVLLGLVGTLSALYLSTRASYSLLNEFLSLLGLVGGGLAGIMALGVFTRRATGTGVLIGAFLSAAATYYASEHTTLHFFLYGMVGFLTAFAAGYLASLLSPNRHFTSSL